MIKVLPDSRDQRDLRRGRSIIAGAILAPVAAIFTILVLQAATICRVEQALLDAAQCGVQAARGANGDSRRVDAAVRRRLAGYSFGRWVEGPYIYVGRQPEILAPLPAARSGDRLSVAVSLPATDVVADWLAPLGLSLTGRKIRVEATAVRESAP